MYFVSEIRICPYAHIVSLYAIELLHWMLWYTMKNRDSQGISFVQISLENWETFILELFQWVCCSLWDKIQNVVVSKRIVFTVMGEMALLQCIYIAEWCCCKWAYRNLYCIFCPTGKLGYLALILSQESFIPKLLSSTFPFWSECVWMS